MNKKMITTLAISAMVFLGGCAQAEDDTLTVGMELQYPPFETTDSKGDPEGISVDLAYALGEYLDRDVEIENISWSGLIPAIQSEKIDVIISSMSIRPDRAESVSFSKPYAHSTLGILANKDSGIKRAEDLNQEGVNIAVKVGTTGFLYVTEQLPNATVNTVDKADTAILEVSQGKSDAFLYDQMTIYNAQKSYPDSTVALLEQFQENTEPWAMAVKLENEELLEDINAFIDEFEANGGFDELGNKYLGEMKQTFDDLGLEFFFQPKSE
ncbi:transporter substrate-binding domain-containing protein [Jeotgalibaca sp. MA1X17-3]|uniref:transporter substrate-binding domain-containing protein n=1 Tax=Jeotgalibaca sp. MA1X17-3 TaxID=2908211 RepID=UPI001F25C84A|nr:transporter substrate-binding domain-containing protein [Jeotgalibaca sp. MA1X17-3]UJF14748.1 transporter substrate-binding domain-containing protein [Jeotgalibaca sp. MA1X17-3]